jgi:hypothetical protein
VKAFLIFHWFLAIQTNDPAEINKLVTPFDGEKSGIYSRNKIVLAFNSVKNRGKEIRY